MAAETVLEFRGMSRWHQFLPAHLSFGLCDVLVFLRKWEPQPWCGASAASGPFHGALGGLRRASPMPAAAGVGLGGRLPLLLPERLPESVGCPRAPRCFLSQAVCDFVLLVPCVCVCSGLVRNEAWGVLTDAVGCERKPSSQERSPARWMQQRHPVSRPCSAARDACAHVLQGTKEDTPGLLEAPRGGAVHTEPRSAWDTL